MDRSDSASTWLHVIDGCVRDGERRKFTWPSWKNYFKEKSKIGHPGYISEAQCPHVLSDNHIAQCKCRALPPMWAVLSDKPGSRDHGEGILNPSETRREEHSPSPSYLWFYDTSNIPSVSQRMPPHYFKLIQLSRNKEKDMTHRFLFSMKINPFIVYIFYFPGFQGPSAGREVAMIEERQ